MFVGTDLAITHHIGIEKFCVVLVFRIHDFLADHLDPLIENLFEIVGRNLRADDFAFFYGVSQCVDKFFLVRFDIETHKMRADVLRNNI